jgi:hypothetical protein
MDVVTEQIILYRRDAHNHHGLMSLMIRTFARGLGQAYGMMVRFPLRS